MQSCWILFFIASIKIPLTLIGFGALMPNFEHAGCLQQYMLLRCCCTKLNLMWMRKFSSLKGLKLFGYFVAVICEKHWFKAPVGVKAAANDLQWYKLLLAHQRIPVFKDISAAAFSAFKRHPWYLSRANPICTVFSPTAGAH